MSEKIVGVLGGMGPEATLDFFKKVIALTPANNDQEHLRIIIDNNPKIPDRTETILTKSQALLPALAATARNLERAGVDFIAIPCNTVHYFYDDLVKETTVPVLHMIREVVKAAKSANSEYEKVGLLATTGTVNANLYQWEFQKAGIEVIAPTPKVQADVMDAILEIKAGHDKNLAKKVFTRVAEQLLEQKAQALILGCTDIPLVIRQQDFAVSVLDSNQILAEAAVKFALA